MSKREERDKHREFDEGLDRLAQLTKQFDMELGALRQVARDIVGDPAEEETAAESSMAEDALAAPPEKWDAEDAG